MSKMINTFRSSLRNNIMLWFTLVLVLGGISINIIFQYLIRKTLNAEGFELSIVENISDYFAQIGGGVTIAGILIILCIAFYISESISKPIKTLTKGLMSIAEGKWDTRISIPNKDEIGQLAEGFNCMAENADNAMLQLKKAKEYTDNIVISVPSILIILSDRLNILSTNIAFENLSEQFPTLSLNQFIDPLVDEISNNLETGKTFKKEIKIIPDKSNINLYFSTIVSAIGFEDVENDIDKDIEKARVLLTITDISKRRKMEEIVIQSKQDWENTFNTIPDSITIHDQEFNIIYANIAAREMLKLTPSAEIESNKCYKYYHGTDVAPKNCPSCNCLHTGMPANFETFEPHLNKYIELRSIPRINEENKVIGLIHIVRDISERKRIEQEHNDLLVAVTKAKLEWELTFDSVNEFILFIDKDLHITRCNKSFSEYAGLPVNELMGYKCHDFFPCSSEYFDELKNNNSPAEDVFIQTEVKTESGRWLYISHRPIFDENNIYTFSVILATDISELKNAQERVEESEEELKMKIRDLEKFYDMAVGRELKMKELKKEIKNLHMELANQHNHVLMNGNN